MAATPHRGQHHDQSQIDAPPQESYRRRRVAPPATLATEAVAPGERFAKATRTTPWLAWIVRPVQSATTAAGLLPSRGREVVIDPDQKREKLRSGRRAWHTGQVSVFSQTGDSPAGCLEASTLREVTPLPSSYVTASCALTIRERARAHGRTPLSTPELRVSAQPWTILAVRQAIRADANSGVRSCTRSRLHPANSRDDALVACALGRPHGGRPRSWRSPLSPTLRGGCRM